MCTDFLSENKIKLEKAARAAGNKRERADAHAGCRQNVIAPIAAPEHRGCVEQDRCEDVAPPPAVVGRFLTPQLANAVQVRRSVAERVGLGAARQREGAERARHMLHALVQPQHVVVDAIGVSIARATEVVGKRHREMHGASDQQDGDQLVGSSP